MAKGEAEKELPAAAEKGQTLHGGRAALHCAAPKGRAWRRLAGSSPYHRVTPMSCTNI